MADAETDQYDELKMDELKDIARERDLEGFSSMKVDELRDALRENDAAPDVEPDEDASEKDEDVVTGASTAVGPTPGAQGNDLTPLAREAYDRNRAARG